MSAGAEGRQGPAAGSGADGIGLDTSVRHSSAVVSVELDGETVLYHEEFGTLHALNRTASVVWEQLDGSATVGEVARLLAAAADADAGTVESDVLDVVQQMGRLGLLHGVALHAGGAGTDGLEAGGVGPGGPEVRRSGGDAGG